MQNDAEHIPLLLRDVARAWRALVDRRLAPLNLTQAQWRALLFASRSEQPLSQTELAELLGIETPSLVRLLDRLCQAGWVERRPSPHDRRTRLVHVTAQSRKLLDAIEAVTTEVRHLALDALGPEETRTFAATLGKLRDSLGKALGEPD